MTAKKISSAIPAGVKVTTRAGISMDADGYLPPDDSSDDRLTYDELLAADAATGWLLKHDPTHAPVAKVLYTGCRTDREIDRAQSAWTSIIIAGRVGFVTLDVDPEEMGSPRSMRPNVPAVVAVELPQELQGPGKKYAVIYCDPDDNAVWRAVNDVTGEVTYLASYDGRSAVAVLYYTAWTLEEVRTWQREGREAVRAIAGRRAPVDVIAELDEEEKQARQRAEMRRLLSL